MNFATPFQPALLDIFKSPHTDMPHTAGPMARTTRGMKSLQAFCKTPVFGAPDIDKVSTSYVERSNLTIRVTNRRFTRLTNGFSKKLANHCRMPDVCFMSYNFCRKHTTLKKTPAQAAEIADKQSTLEHVVEMIERFQAAKENAAFELRWTKDTAHLYFALHTLYVVIRTGLRRPLSA